MRKLTCLIAEDHKLPRLTLKGLLKDHNVHMASTFKEAHTLLSEIEFDIAFLDLDLDFELAGLELAQITKEKDIYSIITTGHVEDEIIEKAYRFGADDYLIKPITQKSISHVFKRYFNFESELRIDNLISSKYVTTDSKTLSELNIIKKVGLTEKPILINGPSGTGKRVVAHIIKDALHISEDRFVELNCAQFSENLIESELFGHKKGAFTGADSEKIGLLAKADKGILFLDEIHSLSNSAQQKLMKAIEEKMFYPVGSNKPVKSEFRVICATCDDLIKLVSLSKFRPDFYARISSLQIQLYPLKERKEDILPLIDLFNSRFSRKITIQSETKELLKRLEWKNNTRDIESLVEYWQIQGFGIISPECIPEQYLSTHKEQIRSLSRNDIATIREIGLKKYLDLLKEQIAYKFLDIHDGNVSEAADVLGVGKDYLYRAKKNSESIRLSKEEVINECRIQ